MISIVIQNLLRIIVMIEFKKYNYCDIHQNEKCDF